MSRERDGKKKYDKSVYRSLALVTQFGINMLVPIGMMSALGIWLDKRLGTSYWTILLFFVGAVAGGRNIYRMSKHIFDADDVDGKEESGGSVYEDNRNAEKQK